MKLKLMTSGTVGVCWKLSQESPGFGRCRDVAGQHLTIWSASTSAIQGHVRRYLTSRFSCRRLERYCRATARISIAALHSFSIPVGDLPSSPACFRNHNSAAQGEFGWLLASALEL